MCACVSVCVGVRIRGKECVHVSRSQRAHSLSASHTHTICLPGLGLQTATEEREAGR